MEIGTWLRQLGLERYEAAFRDNDIDRDLLPNLTADDLKDLGIGSVGHRRRLLEAIRALPEAPPGTSPQIETGAERRQLTVMFCDLAGSTALSSRLDPEDLREVLGSYHKTVAEVVTGFDGYVAKYMGDGVLAYFGYPRAHEDDAERAVRAALALVERIGRLESGSEALSGRVGIATGLVVVGDLIGAGDAQERGVVGETPNLAARLQAMAPENGVIIAESTRRLLGGLFEYRDLGTAGVKGLDAPVTVWQVLRPSAVESRFEALRSTSMAPLVGRDAEMELLLRRWERAKEGEGQIVLISGEPGIGKSRLIATLQERVSGEPHIRLRYFCSPHQRDSVLHPFIAQLEHAAGFAREDEPAARIEKLAELVSRSRDDAPEAAAVFADLLGLPSSAPSPSDPRQKRELTLAALVRQLGGLARQQPVLLIFEDAQWADQTSVELLERAAERVPNLPILMVITFRPEFEPPWTGQAQVTSLTLSRLGQRDTASLVYLLTQGKALPPEVTERIIERTDGIPLFVEELTKTVLEGGLLQEEDDRYVVAGSVRAMAIPASLHDSLLARLDRLAPVKEVAQIGAAIGREFSYDLLVAVARRPERQLQDALHQLTDAGLIFRRGVLPDASFIFKHALVQDAAYGTLLRGRRQDLHAGIATALEQRLAFNPGQPGSAEAGAALLAYHWSNAEEWEKALRYALQAAERARKLYAYPEAVGHYWHALDLLEHLGRTTELIRVHAEVIFSLVLLPVFARDGTERARMLRHVNQALSDATAAGRVALAARLQAIKGTHLEDEGLLTGAISIAEASADTSAEAFAVRQYGQYLGHPMAKYEESLSYLARAVELLGAQGELRQQALYMAKGARCYSARAGRLEEALVYAARARAAGDALADRELQAWRAMEAEVFFYKGCWEDIVRVTDEALPLAQELQDWPVILWSSAWLAIAYLKVRRPTEAREALDRAFQQAPPRALGINAWALAYPQIAMAEVQLFEGNPGSALNSARQAIESSERTRALLEKGAAYRVLGKVLAVIGNRGDAEAAFQRSLEVLEGIQSRPELAQTLLAYGCFRRGDNGLQDRAMIERALALFEEMNATGWIEEARAALA